MQEHKKQISNRLFKQISLIIENIEIRFAQGEDESGISDFMKLIELIENPTVMHLFSDLDGKSLLNKCFQALQHKDFVCLSDTVVYELKPWLQQLSYKGVEC